ncbi:hypothetical protein ACFLZV_04930, partial [Candidatus Margulisiibacteriota bacterium]
FQDKKDFFDNILNNKLVINEKTISEISKMAKLPKLKKKPSKKVTDSVFIKAMNNTISEIQQEMTKMVLLK